MKVYLVGGAVRDELLGLPIRERDWVVVGATPEEMINQGFKKVGKDFPVFLHPKTHEEYALARTERKTGKGYTNFVCHSDPNVTLEDDLKRRDLTINAMAMDEDGSIVDPYNGKEDLKNKILRHVSAAFSEDPVRILRVARFASRFDDFKVHPETSQLMQDMLANGEVDALVSERVWQEWERSLKEKNPEKFFVVLKDCDVLPRLFSEIDANLEKIDKSLKEVVSLTKDSAVRFAALSYNLDKNEITGLCKRYKIPNIYRELSLLVLRLKNDFDRFTKDADGLVAFLEFADGYRRPERIEQVILACQANNKDIKEAAPKIMDAYEATKMIKLSPEDVANNDKTKLRQILHDKRKEKVK